MAAEPGSGTGLQAAGDDTPVIIDAHRHAWDLSRFRYPWLADADGPLPPGWPVRYVAADFRRDSDGVPVAGSVLVEAGREDRSAEAQWLATAAAEAGPLTAVVARVRLEALDIASQLDGLAAAGRVCGVRQVLNCQDEAAGRPSYGASRPDLMADPAWRRGLARLRAAGLTFDLQMEPWQLLQATGLAADFGDVTFILDHGGYLTRRSPETDRIWRAGIAALARQPNVAVKACDYATIDPAFDSAGFSAYVGELLGAFGPQRVLFASNFPAESLTVSYRRLTDEFARAVGWLSPAEQRAVWADNAHRIYRIGSPAGQAQSVPDDDSAAP